MSKLYTNVPKQAVKIPSPFEISIPSSKLSDLQALVKLSPVASPTYESSQEDRRYGVTSRWLTEAKDRWENQFDWRTNEKHINSFPNFKASVDDGEDIYQIHFVALFSKRPDAIPVMFHHGWPGSFLEFLPMLSLMKEQYSPDNLPYHLIVPSAPGYAFSSKPPVHINFSIKNVARIMNQLMLDLGFGTGYIVQGGDLGSNISRLMVVENEACKAVHLNFCMMSEPKDLSGASLDSQEIQGLKRLNAFNETGSAYALEHATRPSTIGIVLSSSPLALLAWIGEKFLEWSDEDPSLDTILESITLYWLTDTFPTSIYAYRQRYAPDQFGAHATPKNHIKKPLGYSWFPKELAPVPRSWVETTGNLVFHRQHSKGGHFAALEQPELLKEDIEAFIKQVWT